MSNITLLRQLAGGSKGPFSQLVNNLVNEPRIAWYPSAGKDLRDLLYLHPDFAKIKPAKTTEPQPPDLFIHSDYFPWSETCFLDSEVIFFDNRTIMSVVSIEELPRIDLPLDPQIVDFPKGSKLTGRVVFLWVEVQSKSLGNYHYPLLYVFAENAAFCEKVALPHSAKFTHIIHVRYGYGYGGGKSAGSWLLKILPSLGCEVFITDGHHYEQNGDQRVLEAFPLIAQSTKECKLEPIRTIDSCSWSGYGNISWNLVIPT